MMVNPARHALAPGEVSTYKVEPYLVAADVYVRQHTEPRTAPWIIRAMTSLLVAPVPEELPKRTDTVRPLDQSKHLAPSNNGSAAFESGYVAGAAARERKSPIPIYLRVARDEYADGFRSGYFLRSSDASARNSRHERQRAQGSYRLLTSR
jgi:hypothetical protein